MARMKEYAVATSDVFQFDPSAIEVDPEYNIRTFNPETDDEDKTLLAQIREHPGVHTPLVVRKSGEKIILVVGHRRLAAVKVLLGEGMEIKSVPCLPEPQTTSPEDRVLNLITSNQGKPLSAIEKAEVLKRLLGMGWTESMLAKKTGYRLDTVRNLLQLSSAPLTIKKMVRENQVSSETARAVMSESGDDANRRLTEALAAKLARGKTRVLPSDLGIVPRQALPQKNSPIPALPPDPPGPLTPRESRWLAALQRIHGCVSVAGAREYARVALMEG